MSWEQIFAEKKNLMSNPSSQIIADQYVAFGQNSAPIIAAPSITKITILNSNESLIDLKQIKHPRIKMAPEPPDGRAFKGPMYNSGLPNCSKMRLNVWKRLQQVPTYLDQFAKTFGYAPDTINIMLFEGLRDLKTQAMLFNNKVKEIRLNNPKLSLEEAETEASKWVSPVKNNVPAHATGAAIDIRLWNSKTETFVDLGTFGVIWEPNQSASTFSDKISDTQKRNRLYLLLACAAAGLVNYPYEYWHFSYGDRYATYWQEHESEKQCALYGAVSETGLQ